MRLEGEVEDFKENFPFYSTYFHFVRHQILHPLHSAWHVEATIDLTNQ